MAAEPRPDGIFRPEALERLLRDEDPREPLRLSPPWTWSLFWALAAASAAALALAILGTVEVNRPGRAIVRPVSGVRLLQAEVSGTLAQTFFRSGEWVRAGQSVAHIHAAQVRGSLLESERQLERLGSTGQRLAETERRLVREQLDSVQERIRSQEAQVRSHDGSVAVRERKAAAHAALFASGLISALELEEARDNVHTTLRQRDAAGQQLTQLRQERAALEASHQRAAYLHAGDLHGARTRRDALDLALGQTDVRAPVDGTLEALVAHPGDLLQAGQPVAKLLPDGSPLQVVAFLAEKDRGSIQPGHLVRLELAAYPQGEFGTLKGRILRIGADLASPFEIREALGEEAHLDEPTYRVEVALLPERPRRLQGVPLRPGMVVQARFVVRRQRIITLVLAPLRQWLP